MLTVSSFLLILSFTTDLGNKEEYVIDHSLTKQDCYERMNEEYNDRQNETVEQMYKDAAIYDSAVEAYKAVKMEGKVVKVELSCVKGE
nr:MAG TPA: hypothetical protein [Caudoviricetes sp.]